MFHPKVTAGVLAGAVTGILVSELARRGVPISAGEASDITLIVMFAAGFFMPSDPPASPTPSAPNPPAPPPAASQS